MQPNSSDIAPSLSQNTGRGWPARQGWQRVVLTAPETVINQNPDEQSAVVVKAMAGEEVDIGTITKAKGRKWCRVALADNRQGFIPGETAIRGLVHARLHQPKATLRTAPDPQGTPIRQLSRGDTILLLETINNGSGQWVRTRDAAGVEGYVEGNVKIKSVAAKAENSPERDMIVGAIWCIGGIVVTAATYSAVANSGGTYVVAWGAILFGGIQFIKGLFRAITR